MDILAAEHSTRSFCWKIKKIIFCKFETKYIEGDFKMLDHKNMYCNLCENIFLSNMQLVLKIYLTTYSLIKMTSIMFRALICLLNVIGLMHRLLYVLILTLII